VNFLSTRTVPPVPAGLLKGGAITIFVVALGMVAYSNFWALLIIVPIAVGCGVLAYKNEVHFLGLFFVLLPILGFLNLLLDVKGICLILLVFISGLAGRTFKYKISEDSGLGFSLPLPVLIYGAYLLLSFLYSAGSLLITHPGLKDVVSRAPWGDVVMSNAMAWVLLALFNAGAGVLLFEWIRNGGFTPADRIFFFRSLLVGMFVAFLVGILQFSGWETLAGGLSFIRGTYPQYNATFSHPNTMGIFAALIFSVLLGLVFQEGKNNLLLYSVLLMVLFLVFISASRSAFMITAFSLLLRFVYSLVHKKKMQVLFLLLLVFLGAGFVLSHSYRFGEASRFTRVADRIKLKLAGKSAPGKMMGDRRMLWKAGWVTLKNNPVVGVGLGSYLFRMPRYENQIGRIFNDNTGNMYLHIAAEQGILGLISFLVLAGYFLKKIVARGIKGVGSFQWGVHSAFMGLLLAFLFGSHVLGFETSILFWFLISMMAVPYEIH